MERMKKILLKVLSVTSPLLILALLGVMQGAWFDSEEFIGLEDAELHHPTAIQYTLYYLVSILLFAFWPNTLWFSFGIRHRNHLDMRHSSLNSSRFVTQLVNYFKPFPSFPAHLSFA